MSAKKPPVADIRPHLTTQHGYERTDNYHWLRADNWQDVMRDPSVLADDIRTYLDAENVWFEDEFEQPNADLIDRIYKEIRGRIKEDDQSVPTPDGPFAYTSKMATGQQYPILVRTPREGGDEEILIDCNVEAGDGYFGFAGASHDPSHRYLAWGADKKGSEYYTIRVRDLKSGKELDDVIENSSGGAVWLSDSSGFVYTEQDENHRPYRVRKHILGTPQSDDPIIYTEKNSGFFVGVGQTQSRAFITINAHDHQTSEVYLLDPMAALEPRLVSERLTDREYDVEEHEGQLFILTNANGAEDFKIVSVDAANPESENWVDVIPHRTGVLIVSMFVLKGLLVRLERADGLPRIIIRNLATGSESPIDFDEEAYALGVSAGYEFETRTLRFSYSSPTTPSQVWDYDITTGERILLKAQEVPSGHDPKDYATRRIFAVGHDGAEIPITLLMKAGTAQDGSAPCLLYAYGSYGMSTAAQFSVSALSLVDRGFVYAIAHVRGGMEKGYHWYADGRREKKVNTFTDFIAAANYLAGEKYVDGARIIAQGGSAGGMLMGAIANMAPARFAGIIAQVPFVDVLTTMSDESLPLTPPEWPEWGNPIASQHDYETIAAYSPYDNVSAQAYPSIFALAGLTDPRVTYWEPAKWVARLRAMNTGDLPLYLRTNMGAGHGGASGRFDRIKETAMTYAFAVKTAGAPESMD